MTVNASAPAPQPSFRVPSRVLSFFGVLPLPGPVEMLFYDGHCGLCHRTVQFVLRHDPSGQLFHFSPLQGETFAAQVAPERRAALPESIVILSADNRLLVRSDATLHMLRRLGGGWRALAAIAAIVPRPLRDAAYNLIARIRFLMFGRKDDLCPVVPPNLRSRFRP